MLCKNCWLATTGLLSIADNNRWEVIYVKVTLVIIFGRTNRKIQTFTQKNYLHSSSLSISSMLFPLVLVLTLSRITCILGVSNV